MLIGSSILSLLSANLRKYHHKVTVLDLNNQLFLKCKEEYRGKWEQEEDICWINKEFIERFASAHNDLINDYVEQILDSGSEIVGFSIYFTNVLMSLKIARLIKEKDKNKIIIFGGPQCMRRVGGINIIKEDCVDAIVVNEGDDTILEIAKIIEACRSLRFCLGMLFKKNGSLFDCGDRSPIVDLDSLPFADFSDFAVQEYLHPYELPILASRGCIWNCLFCTGKMPWQQYRSQSGERVLKEIKHQLNRHPQAEVFAFHDCLINGNINELDKFCQLIIQENRLGRIKNFKWLGQAVIRKEMTKDLLQKMKLAGCERITYGIESGSDKIIHLMGKRYDSSVASEVIKNSHEAGIKVTAIFMFGFPGETKEDFRDTLDFLEKNREYLDEAIPADGLCVIERHSPLYQNAKDHDLFLNPHPFFWKSLSGDNGYKERFRRFEVFCERSNELGIKLSGSYDKNRRYKRIIFKEYDDYCTNINFNICRNLISKELRNGLSFRWEINNQCHLRCLYCDSNSYTSLSARYLNPEKWEYLWKNINDRYGPVRIIITGGEPYIYPEFSEIARRLSSLNALEIHTNVPNEFIVDNILFIVNKVKFCLNFHLGQSNLEVFLQKANLLKEREFLIEIYCLAYPSQVWQIPYIEKKLEDIGLKLSINSFYGRYENKVYPDNYTQAELDILKPRLGDLNRIGYHLKGESPKGKLCNAGYTRCVIKEDSTAVRCKFCSEEKIGSILDNSLTLFNEPQPCNIDFCPYNEFDSVY